MTAAEIKAQKKAAEIKAIKEIKDAAIKSKQIIRK